MRLAKIMAVVAALVFSVPAAAQALWQNVELGMSLSQVAAAQPDAVANSNPGTLNSGASCDLHIEDYVVVGDPFEVCFFFNGGALEQVTLGHRDNPSEPDFQAIVTALTARYGQPLVNQPTAIGRTAEWLTDDGVNITVAWISRYGALLNVVYQVRISRDAERL